MGCFENEFWYFTWNRTNGLVTFDGHLSAEHSRSGAIYRYGIPSRVTANPFGDLAALRRAVDGEWWELQHAGQVVLAILLGRTGMGLGEEDLALFARLSAEVLENRAEAERIVLTALSAEVGVERQLVLRRLQQASGQKWPARDLDRWAAWLADLAGTTK